MKSVDACVSERENCLVRVSEKKVLFFFDE